MSDYTTDLPKDVIVKAPENPKQKRKARWGFNPKSQEKIKIPAKTVVKFRVAKTAKDAILGVRK
jgi:hypothetical protein